MAGLNTAQERAYADGMFARSATIRATSASDPVAVTDVLTGTLQTARWKVNASDTVAVTDATALSGAGAGRSAIETVAVTDVLTATLKAIRLTVTSSESVAVTDVPTVTGKAIRLTVGASEPVVVTDFWMRTIRTVRVTAGVSESVAVTEFVQTPIRLLTASVSDAVTATDAWTTLQRPSLLVGADEDVAVADWVVPVVAATGLKTSVSEGVAVADALLPPTLKTVRLKVSVGEPVSVADDIQTPNRRTLSLREIVAVTDVLTVRLSILKRSVSDTVAVTEFVRRTTNLTVSVGEPVTVTDAQPIALRAFRLKVNASEVIGVTDDFTEWTTVRAPVLAFVDPLSGYAVLIHPYQWGFTEGVEYVTREFGTTPYGAWHRQWLPNMIRTLTVRFASLDIIIEQLETLTMLVQRHGGPVKFYARAVHPDFLWVEWPAEVPLSRVVENREAVELRLVTVDPDFGAGVLAGDDSLVTVTENVETSTNVVLNCLPLERRSKVSVGLIPMRGGVVPTGADLQVRRERRFVSGLIIRCSDPSRRDAAEEEEAP